MSRFVIVDRNAIHENDQDGGDRPTIMLYLGDDSPDACRVLEVYDSGGVLVGTFRSQALHRHVDYDRPHVWFELAPGAEAVVKL